MSASLPSSAPVIVPLRTYGVASKAWLKAALAHPLLTPANKTVCAALYFYFNCKHYRQTGELLAWPSWDTLMAMTGLSRTTIAESIDQIEHYGLLDRERGRYDRGAQRRAGNRYRARMPVRDLGPPNRPDQGPESGPNQGPGIGLYFLESPSPLGESRLGEEEGCPTKEGKPSEEELKASLDRLRQLAAAERGRP